MDKRLTKSENRMLSGVCAGIAEYLGWDATLVRVVYALLSICLAGFPGLLIYIILAILMPSKEG
jgi:phage shock protein C